MEEYELTRDCEAIRIPAGDRITLESGTNVYLQQRLGGSITVQAPRYGGLFRIADSDADALGLQPTEGGEIAVDENLSIDEKVETVLKTCFDPEIPVNIVDLGLVYDTRIAEHEEGGHRVDIQMTLTAVGCGMGGAIAADAEDKLRRIPEVRHATVGIVWDPPWSPQMISEEGRKKLGLQ